MKKRFKRAILFFVLFLISFIALLQAAVIYMKDPYKTFIKDVVIEEKEENIGVNITCLQKIHGTSGMRYRYELKTDCPYWEFEGRYETDEPLPVPEDYDAVEAYAKDIRILYDGKALTGGQHFYFPTLNMNMDDINYVDYKTGLLRIAYERHVANKSLAIWHIGIVFIVIFCIGMAIFVWVIKKQRNKTV